jgi:anaerobic C4-dicarboxylate transporter-like protein
MWFELAIVLGAILLGARLGGIGLGAAGGIALVILVFGFGLPPGSPPASVLGMIVAVITALAAMQSAGGLDYLVVLAARLMEKHPQRITVFAPFITFALVMASGTQHVMYALMPVIVDVSIKGDVRPERPLSMSVIASQCGLIASPISAVTVAMAGYLAGFGISLLTTLGVTLVASIIGTLAGILSVSWRGGSLSADPVYQERVRNGAIGPGAALVAPTGEALRNARGSLAVFLLAILAVVAIGLFPDLRPTYAISSGETFEYGQIETGRAIMIVMLAAAGVMMVFFKAKADDAVRSSIMRGGIVAVISILGVSWMGSSFFEGNRAEIVQGIADLITAYPLILALGMFVLSILLISQAATVVTLVPVVIALGFSGADLLGIYPAVNGCFFLPTYGTILAAVSFDATGTTRIGRYLLNHSFMVPGLVTVGVSTLAAVLLARFIA